MRGRMSPPAPSSSCTLRGALPQGKSGEFCIIAAPDWVTVVPLLVDEHGEDRFLLVRQYRHGGEIVTTEFPAGLVDPGEEPLHAAERELAEETGYRAGRMTLLGRVSPNPAFMSNWCTTWVAEDLELVGEPSLDDTEELRSFTLSAADMRRRMGTGELVNSQTLVSFFLWERWRAAARGGGSVR